MADPNSAERWLPMDDAPRDGRVILGKFYEGIVSLVWWNTDQKLPSDPFWFCGVPGKYQTAPNIQPCGWQHWLNASPPHSQETVK